MIALLFATGCDDDDDTQIDDQVGVAIDEGRAQGTSLAQMADADLSGQTEAVSIEVGMDIMLTIDEGEIAMAEAALDRGVQGNVAVYAEKMIVEHTAHMDLVMSLLATQGLAPRDNRVSQALRAETEIGLDVLDNAAQVDIVYMDMQVSMHESASILVDSLDDHIQTSAFEVLIEDTVDIIDAHRDEAVAILRSLLQ